MWGDLLAALGLLFVLEGIFPFLNPNGVRQTLLQITKANDRILRLAGLGSMVFGLIVLYLVRGIAG
ncbi:MAG: DUF2065 domain-containing protein [Candidatus Competibacteraceae bacterium]|jgi:uncharacterized protein YjeT (DUF2065 family)|nr:DUF2065 domain-containing protein [Candidatus Competibacteraceae bacterium]